MYIDQNIRLVRLLTDLERLKFLREDQFAEALEQGLRKYLKDFPDIFATREMEEIKLVANMLTEISYVVHKQAHVSLLQQRKNTLLDESGIGFVLLDEQAEPLEMNRLAEDFFQQEYQQHSLNGACADLMGKFSYAAAASPHGTSSLTLGDFLLKRRGETHLDPFGYASTLYVIEINPLRFRAHFQKKFQLSAREAELLDLLYEGLSNDAIAAKLFISINTVRTHLKSIYKKADVSSQNQLLYLYGTYLQP